MLLSTWLLLLTPAPWRRGRELFKVLGAFLLHVEPGSSPRRGRVLSLMSLVAARRPFLHMVLRYRGSVPAGPAAASLWAPAPSAVFHGPPQGAWQNL